ncbi:MAG: hypothetical protein KA354_14910 [Phycisphaerae bacterium]|nr:hypothetical protein [Phycisphaerae bacterium]
MRAALASFGAVLYSMTAATGAEPAKVDRQFLDCKTVFQTNTGYDPRLAIAVDGVIVHQHGAAPERLGKTINSWRRRGFTVGRMFFADSDATNQYWTGKWDGTEHPDEVERDQKNDVVMCAGVRPYMLPTPGWTRYLQEMATQSIDLGAQAILPEEPLAHAHTGYENAFRKAWEQRYHRPWEPERTSPTARFLTGQLKNELYLELQRQLGQTVVQGEKRTGQTIPFVFPVHSLYSNVAAHLVAPLGTSTAIEQIDGYIGQVWTGPVNWALHNYSSPDKSFFASAYVLYDYFDQLTRGTNRKLWLLTDPVEDDPNHKWSEFEEWYRHCVAAELLLPNVDAFEVMPWPDRIFLPGYSTGGSTPAPERFRIIVLSAIQVQQEIPRSGTWLQDPIDQPTAGIGVAVTDTLLWHQLASPLLDGVYGMFLPLVNEGIPASACLLERALDPGYLDQFKVIVLSYQEMKPMDLRMNTALANWVRRGGSLIVLGTGGEISDGSLWWSKLPIGDPLAHLLKTELGLEPGAEGDRQVGQGWVYRQLGSPRRFVDPRVAREEYLRLIERALRAAGGAAKLARPGEFVMRRGPFVIAHAIHQPVSVKGPVVDVFDPEFPLRDKAELKLGQSGVYRDVTSLMTPTGPAKPCVLHATHRLLSEQFVDNTTRALIRGPAETPAIVRLFAAGSTPQSITATDAKDAALEVTWKADGPTILVRFPNVPEGATLIVKWTR